MVLLSKLTINNFLSHKETVLEFPDECRMLIDGKSGTGKSSIVDAILWVIYGKARVENRNLIRHGEKGMSVQLQLVDGSNTWLIYRHVNDKGKHVLSVTHSIGGMPYVHIPQSGIKDIQDWIEKTLIGASYELFVNSIAYTQDREDSFVKQNASKRKDILLEIINVGSIDEYYNKTKSILSENEINRENLVNTIAGHEALIDRNKLELTDIESVKNELEYVRNKIAGLRTYTSDAYNDVIKYTESVNILNTGLSEMLDEKLLLSEIMSQHDKIQSYRTEIKKLPEIEEEIIILERDINDNARVQYERNSLIANKPAARDFDREIDVLMKRLSELSQTTNNCPSGELCPFFAPILSQREFINDEINKKKVEKNKHEGDLVKYSEKLVKMPPVRDLTKENAMLQVAKNRGKAIRDLYKLVADFESLTSRSKFIASYSSTRSVDPLKVKNRIKELEYNMEKQKERVVIEESEIRKANGVILKNKDIVAPFEELIITLLKKISAAEYAEKNIKDFSSTVKDLKEQLIIKDKTIESLTVLKKAFGSNGIRTMVIDYIIPKIEEQVNVILRKLSDFSVRFDTQRSSVDGDSIIEGLFIEIFNDKGELHDFDSYSGGEKLKITVAISEALASLQKVGFRLIDELFLGLDEDSTESFSKVLYALQEEFKQVLCISHMRYIKDMFERVMVIKKIDGISNIEII